MDSGEFSVQGRAQNADKQRGGAGAKVANEPESLWNVTSLQKRHGDVADAREGEPEDLLDLSEESIVLGDSSKRQDQMLGGKGSGFAVAKALVPGRAGVA
jgi:hypothetical protein